MWRFQVGAMRLLAVFAIAVCGVILTDYLFAGSFCSFGSGCESVISSAYGRPLGVPLPVVGIVGFGLILGLTLCPRRGSFMVRTLAVVAGLAGLALVLVQLFVLRQICSLCLLVDVCGIGLAGVSLAGNVPRDSFSWLRCLAWLGAAVFVTAMPPLLGWLKTNAPAPEKVTAYWVAGKINVVEVTDFECAYCRAAEPALGAFLREHGAKVHFVRLVAPMPALVHSWPAARAFLAAEMQGKGEAMAAALFAAPSRHAQGCRDLAKSLDLDLNQYDRVVNDPATVVKLDANVTWAKAKAPGLPLAWVQNQLVQGVITLESLQAALKRAQRSTEARR